jgi:long-chain acyl-CoA synthetase
MAPPKVIKELEYAVEVECSEPNTKHWRHPWCYKNNGGELAVRPLVLPKEEKATIATCVNAAAAKYGDRPCMGTRVIAKEVREGKKKFWYKGDYEWKTYSEVQGDIQAAAKGLLTLDGVQDLKKAGSCTIAILADTSAEWQMAAQSAFQIDIPITTVYTTLGHDAMVHGLNETECPVLVLDFEQYGALKKTVLPKCEKLKHVVFIGKCWVPQEVQGGEKTPFPGAEQIAAMQQECAAKLTTMDMLIAKGKAEASISLANMAPLEDNLAFIMYTSGSTGLPKGVMLTQKNFVSLTAGVEAQGVIRPGPEDVYISYLPLAHILALIGEANILMAGARMGYGSPKTLTSGSPFIAKDNIEGSDLLALAPTFMLAVPAILDLIKTGLEAKLKAMEGFKGQLVRTAVKHAQGEHGEESTFASFLSTIGLQGPVLRKVKAQLGLQDMRIIGSGGAPLSASTHHFISCVLAPVAQGYGCTETTGAMTIQEVVANDGRPADLSAGKVGPVQPSAEIKLKSEPDMGYTIDDKPNPRGELLLSGHNVTQLGYYKMEEKTAEDLPKHDSDGQRWFHSGDIGEMMPNGTVKIIDRKKDLIKLSGGEYVALGKVEAALKQVEGIGAVVVFASPDKDHCVCIVSQPEKGWNSVGGKPDEAALVKAIAESLRAQKLANFEIPKKVKVDDEIWTPESGLTTASMKLQRNPLRTFYNKPGGLLEQMGYSF